VVLFHVFPNTFSGGYIGVDLFFVISGFVITKSVIRSLDASGKFSFGGFWMRRFWRLAPAVGIMTTTITVAGLAFLSIRALHESSLTFLSSYGAASNFVIYSLTGDYFSLPDELNAGLHMWSLSVEEQYYLGFSLLMLVLVRLVGGGGKQAAPLLSRVLLMAFLISLIVAAVGATDALDGWIADFLLGFYSPLPRLWEFALGSLIFFSSRAIRQPRRVVSSGIRISGILTIVVLSTGLISGGEAPFSVEVLLATFAGGAVIAAGAKSETVSFLENRALGWFGEISYSFYLWHWPFIVIAQQVSNSSWAPFVGGMLSLMPAALSFYLVEKPLARGRNDKMRFRVIGALSIAVPVGALLAAALISTSLLPKLETSTDGASPPGDCAGTVMEICAWNVDHRGIPIYLIGDSNANQYRDPIYQVSLRAGRPLYRSVMSGCPPLDRGMTAGITLSRECEVKNAATMDWLAHQEPGLVVVGFSLGYWSKGSISPAPSIDDVVSSVESTAVHLERMGHSVLIISPMPVWPDGSRVGPTYCSVWHLASSECAFSLKVEDMLGNSPAANSVLQAFAEGNHSGRVFTLDLTNQVCPQGICHARDGGRWIWRDPSHLSTEMALSFTEAFSTIFTETTRSRP
jgi:peptidoglycan/LPS O-acetylase OafA/YrhL